MKGKNLAKLLLALGIGAATVFSGAALAACGGGGNDGNTSNGDTTNTPPDDSNTPNDSNPPDDGNPPNDSNPPDDGNKNKNPVIKKVKTTDEGMEELAAGDPVELKADVAVTVELDDGVTGEYPLFIMPVECLNFHGGSSIPYPNLVITAEIDGEEYEYSWATFWGMMDEEEIDFTGVASFTVTASEDVSVYMALLDSNYTKYEVLLNIAVNGKPKTWGTNGFSSDNVEEGTSITEEWILDLIGDFYENCELLGIYADYNPVQGLINKIPAGFIVNENAAGFHTETNGDGEPVRVVEVWVDLHNFLEAAYIDNDGSFGDGRTYFVDNAYETVLVDVDGITVFLDEVDIGTLDGWTVSYTLEDFYHNDMKEGDAPWTLPVGRYVLRVTATKAGQKPLSTLLYYNVEVWSGGGDNPPIPPNPPVHDPFESMEVIGIETQNFKIYTDESYNFMDVLFVTVQFADDEYHPLSLSQIERFGGKVDVSAVDFNTPGTYIVSGIYRDFEFSFTVVVAERELVVVRGRDNAVRLEEFKYGSIKEAIDNCMIEFVYNDGSASGVPIGNLIDEGIVVNYDSVRPVVGVYQVGVSYKGFSFLFDLFVFDSDSDNHSVVAISSPVKDIYRGISAEEVYNSNFIVYYYDGDQDWVRLSELGVSFEDVEGLGLDVTGEKTLSVSYGDYSGTLTFNVVERHVLLVFAEEFTVFLGTTVEEVLYGLRCNIVYDTGYLDSLSLGELGLTEEDFADINFNAVGEKTLTFTYEGLSCTVKFKVKEVEPVYTFTGTDTKSILALKGVPVTQIKVYNNMTAEVTLFGVDQPVIMNVWLYTDDNILSLEGNIGVTFIQVMFNYDISLSSFTDISIDDLDNAGWEMMEIGSYSGQVDGKDVTFTLYNYGNGYAVYTSGGNQYLLNYQETEGNVINILGIGFFELDYSTRTFVFQAYDY